VLTVVQALNPGNLKTPLQRHIPLWQMIFFGWMLHTPIHGAYTELFAALSPDVTQDHNGAWSMSSAFLNQYYLLKLNSCTLGAFRSSSKGHRGCRQVGERGRDRRCSQVLGVDRGAGQGLSLRSCSCPSRREIRHSQPFSGIGYLIGSLLDTRFASCIFMGRSVYPSVLAPSHFCPTLPSSSPLLASPLLKPLFAENR
jgi:hypothetical protein